MRKPVLPILLLLLAGLACNLPMLKGAPTVSPAPSTATLPPAATFTPTSLPTATLIPTAIPSPTVTLIAGYEPILWVPIHAVRVMDDDGKRIAKITSAQIQAWVAEANRIYAWSGIQFTFDPKDFTLLSSTLLNNISGVEDSNWFEEIAYGDQIAAQTPDKLVLFFRWGPGEDPTGGAFSSVDYNFVAMSGFDTGVCGYQNIGMLAHEIGHYLGLPHTFPAVYANPAEAEAALKKGGNSARVFDADGFSDTLPDPFIALEEYQCQPVEGVTLNGRFFRVPRDNIMSYYEVRNGLSPMQIERARWVLSARLANGMSLPKNSKAPQPLEAHKLSILSISGCSTIYQEMNYWGRQQWFNGDQLFLTSGSNCSLTLRLPVERTARYRLELYLTTTPDFGRIQVYLDGAPVGEPIDLYTPLVMPSGALPMGIFDLAQGDHELRFKVVGTNPKSNNYSFGLDCFSLVEQK